MGAARQIELVGSGIAVGMETARTTCGDSQIRLYTPALGGVVNPGPGKYIDRSLPGRWHASVPPRKPEQHQRDDHNPEHAAISFGRYNGGTSHLLP